MRISCALTVMMVYYTLGTEYLLTDAKPLKEVYFHGERPIVIAQR